MAAAFYGEEDGKDNTEDGKDNDTGHATQRDVQANDPRDLNDPQVQANDPRDLNDPQDSSDEVPTFSMKLAGQGMEKTKTATHDTTSESIT